MISDEQLTKWVDGDSVHNTDRDECCPDFSCCNPLLLAPKVERETFKRLSDPEIRTAMLTVFLRRLVIATSDKKVYIAGELNHEETEQ